MMSGTAPRTKSIYSLRPALPRRVGPRRRRARPGSIDGGWIQQVSMDGSEGTEPEAKRHRTNTAPSRQLDHEPLTRRALASVSGDGQSRRAAARWLVRRGAVSALPDVIEQVRRQLGNESHAPSR